MSRTQRTTIPHWHATEAQIQHSILRLLELHPAVAWAARLNTGAAVFETPLSGGSGTTRYVKFGFPGMADIIGQLTDGRILAIEVKSQAGRLSPNQKAFLDTVRTNNGVAVCARTLQDVYTALQDVTAAALAEHTNSQGAQQ